MALRETGSILVSAPRDLVFEVVRRRMQGEPGLRVEDDRISTARSTWVVREAADGTTRVTHALVEPTFLVRPADLRRTVSEDLLAVQKLASLER